ncbi:MAG: DUF2267 domain-containing protein [Leptolyngbyaceae cyanobacterium bins.349]|nr:DUF2267 domain-containing protein [Leptolyngbyaceae cyanobacterium bins.349]
MTEQTSQLTFLEKVVARSGLETTNEAQRAANVVFRLLRDMMTNKESNQIERDLRNNAPEAEQEAIDLWQDYNVMVGFFSRISPLKPLHIRPGTFLLRLREEGTLPEGVAPEQVAQAVFAATKEILPQERNQQVAEVLPGEIRHLWEQA